MEPTPEVTPVPQEMVVQQEPETTTNSSQAEQIVAEEQQYAGETLQTVSEHQREYPSLYDTYGTTMIAVVFAVSIVTGVIGLVQYIYRRAASDHSALTQFVTTMFALIAGVFVADKIVAGPSTELLNGQESMKVLEFIQQTCLMVFAYYFGTKAQPPSDGPLNKED